MRLHNQTKLIRKSLFFTLFPGSVNHAQQHRRHANLQLCFVRWESTDVGPIHWTEHSKWIRLSVFECDLVFIVSHAQNGIHESNLHVFLAPSAGHVDRLIVHVRGPATAFAQSLQENSQILKCYFLLLHKWMGKWTERSVQSAECSTNWWLKFHIFRPRNLDVYEYECATIMEENR